MEEKKIKIQRRSLKVPKELKNNIDILSAVESERRIKLSTFLGTGAKYHLGGDLRDLINSLGEIYYDMTDAPLSEQKIPVEYLYLPDELYNKLKSNNINEIERDWVYLGDNGIEQLDKHENYMLYESIMLVSGTDDLKELGVAIFDEIDLEKEDIKKQLMEARMDGTDVLDMPVGFLALVESSEFRLKKVAKCTTVNDVVQMSESELSKFCGEEEIKDIKDTLSKLNLQLKAEEFTL